MQRVRGLAAALAMGLVLLPAAPASADGASEAAARAAARCADSALLPTASNLTLIRRSTLCLLNAERRARGVRSLREQSALRSAATRYAQHMVRESFFAHVSPGGSTMMSRLRETSYLRRASSYTVGENLAWGGGDRATPAATVQAWMASPGHRVNILKPRFRDIGIGVVPGAPATAVGASTSATYVTEFGRRR